MRLSIAYNAIVDKPKRTVQIFSRVTPEEKAAIERAAAAAFQKPGAWLRQLALSEAMRSVDAGRTARRKERGS